MRLILLLAAIGLCCGPALGETVQIPATDGAVLSAKLVMPQGPVRAPAVVALHGCGGPFPARDDQWATTLAGQGHIVLLPDSFGPRGLGSQCRNTDRRITASRQRRQDALSAARWLMARSGTPPGGVVLLGWSNGASTVLAAGRTSPDLEPGLLRGLIGFYPGCRDALKNASWAPAAPLLILIGESDDWTPAAPCRDLAARFPGRITLVTYPGAYHDFDAPDRTVTVRRGLAYTAEGSGVAHAGTDPAARADALARVPAFLDALAGK